MNKNLNGELMEIREGLALRDRLLRELKLVEQALADGRAQLKVLANQLQAEGEDVRRLQGLSFVGLYYAVIGSKDYRLEEEKRELLAAQLKYDHAQRRLSALEHDLSGIRERLAGMGDLPARYHTLLVKKERRLRSTGGETAERLAALEDALVAARVREREVDEALAAGERARAGLVRVVEALTRASNWGTWDLLGGGVLTSAVKHSHLDDANTAVQEVEPLLQKFERELADVNAGPDLSIEAGGFAAFADIFIDGLLIDLLMQSRINESLKAAQEMTSRVQGFLLRLENDREAVRRDLSSLTMDRSDLLEQAEL